MYTQRQLSSENSVTGDKSVVSFCCIADAKLRCGSDDQLIGCFYKVGSLAVVVLWYVVLTDTPTENGVSEQSKAVLLA